MLSNFLKREATPSLPTGSLWLDIKVSVEIIFADCPWSYFPETLNFVDFYIAMLSSQLKLQEAVSVLTHP